MIDKVLANRSSIKICVLILFFSVAVLVFTNERFTKDIQYTVRSGHPKNPKMKISSLSEVMRSNISEYRDHGYLLTIDYKQQTTAGFKTYNQLAAIAGLLNLSCVEPYVYHDGLKGGADYKDRHALKLSSLYDFSQMKNATKSCAKTDLKSFQEFLDNASPHVVLVSFITSVKKPQFSFLKDKDIVEFDCHNNIPNIQNSIKTLNSWTVSYNVTTNKLFSCSRVVLLDARPKHELPLRDIIDVLGSIVREQVEMFGSATVVLDSWTGLESSGNSSYFPYVSGFMTKGCYGAFTLEHSKLVISAAHHFVECFNLTQPVVGVHIRGERLLRDAHWNIEYSIDCLQQLYNFLHNHSVIGNSFPEKVYVFHDLGKYGSASCEKTKECNHARPELLSKLKQLRFREVYFDPSNFTSFPNNRVFASFVEREYLSHVQVLVAVGRGGFQKSIVNRFLKYSKRRDLYRICNSLPSKI